MLRSHIAATLKDSPAAKTCCIHITVMQLGPMQGKTSGTKTSTTGSDKFQVAEGKVPVGRQ